MKALALAALFAAGPVFACEACFGAEGHAQTNGMNSAILTLLGVTASVLLFFAVFIARIAWRTVQWNRSRLQTEAAA